MDKYLSSFEEIRQIQEFIVRRAREVDVAVIENENMDTAVPELMELVFTEVERVQVDEAE
jgi:2-phosphoglycerate kinase